ncbi:MAG: tRNA (cmo5U34)-methyltransferase [Solirubrobacteraceae bacterium]|nr:tRNA (cmo5U34)-methyltransferase [Solirubrobacteraceae bacterium]
MGQFHWDPGAYLELMRREVPDYERLQDELVDATRAVRARTILELGTGTGETARRVLAAHPRAHLHGIDASGDMLAVARAALDGGRTTLAVWRLQDALPPGPFDLVVSALAVHHLDAAGKAALFARVAAILGDGGRFVLADVVVPADPADALTPFDPSYDLPSPVADQLVWLREAGLRPSVAWTCRDLAVLVAQR